MEILIYQSMITLENEKKLTPNELYLYAQLRKRMTYSKTVETSVEILSKKLSFLKTPKRNRKAIRDLLESLQQKGFITYMEADGVVDVAFVYFEENFDLVPLSVLDLSQSPEDFMVLAFVFRHQKYTFTKTCMLARDYAGKLLECSEATARNILEELVNKGQLVKIAGKFKEDELNRKEANQFKIPFINGTEEAPQPMKRAEKPQVTEVKEVIEPVEEEPAQKQLTEQYELELAERLKSLEKLPPKIRAVKEKSIKQELHEKYFPKQNEENVEIDYSALQNEKVAYKPRLVEEKPKFDREHLQQIQNGNTRTVPTTKTTDSTVEKVF
ncbi:hypothetical protein [Peribacillus simplex]|uniref:hypothetical protein n=1 Tax=Peribacillus simplex TaxID=1478 RepID=UPI0011A3C35F|nr:hypothetical protein [Peribacillus simplex]